MHITLNLSDEETDALALKTAAFNASIKVSFSPEEYLIEEAFNIQQQD